MVSVSKFELCNGLCSLFVAGLSLLASLIPNLLYKMCESLLTFTYFFL